MLFQNLVDLKSQSKRGLESQACFWVRNDLRIRAGITSASKNLDDKQSVLRIEIERK